MNDDFEQDPEDGSPVVEDDGVEYEPDLTDPNYHAPNRCQDPNCLYPQCDDDDGAGEEKFPGEDIWWKTHDNWNR